MVQETGPIGAKLNRSKAHSVLVHRSHVNGPRQPLLQLSGSSPDATDASSAESG